MSVTILGIETSCDETSAAVVRDGRIILSNVISSQADEHAAYGGVVPEMASRGHLESIIPVVDEAVKKSGLTLRELDAVAVTYGPGLVGALLVGLSFAKGLARSLGIPLIGVHHVTAHIAAASLCEPPPEPPFIALVVSGGHSGIYRVENYRSYSLLGRTRDDAAGEAFDKVARTAGLGYPGGRALEKSAVCGNPAAIRFPRSYFRDGTYDYSFSGVKTAAINYLRKEQAKTEAVESNLPPEFMRDFFASFQAAVVEALVTNAVAAEREHKTGKIAVTGGVAVNGALRAEFKKASDSESGGCKFSLYIPAPILCTDNAAMVAARGYHDYLAGAFSPMSLNASPSAPI